MKGVGWPVLISLGLHVALAVAVLRAPSAWLEGEPEPEPVEITILTPEPEPRPDAPAEEETAPEPRPVPPEPEEAPSQTAPAAAAIQLPGPAVEPDTQPGTGEPVPSVVELPSVEQEPRPAREETAEERRQRLAAMLDPSRVARGSYVPTGPGPSQRSGPAGLQTGPRGPSEAEIERRLQDGLRAEAMTKNHTTRERVVPRRRSDGSYAWQGHRFTAIIQPDGSVDFEDQGNVQTDGFSTSGSFDAMDAIMGAAGQDPYGYERERFMRETEELRHRLEAEHRRQQMARGLRGLRGRLSRVWGTESRSHAQRRRRIFQIWDEIAEDGSSAGARELVITFIRETLPQGHEHAYTTAEISRFNGERESTERFEPY